ncbi:hypothetical protein BC440_08330 [Thalassospira sp. MIT1004]|uniref:Uncharacterized protein n=1 Tax=Thalassospira permensis NBRC 106175 TaxID=1353532 RepID=A0ABR4TI49_9PROT|nr:hypothetical protein SMB34_09930 [Thalassospira permensis NBRC 106175]OHZ00850.1 hypothetical protein BC440_08330 [Thalassospira sp. MIT1004]
MFGKFTIYIKPVPVAAFKSGYFVQDMIGTPIAKPGNEFDNTILIKNAAFIRRNYFQSSPFASVRPDLILIKS